MKHETKFHANPSNRGMNCGTLSVLAFHTNVNAEMDADGSLMSTSCWMDAFVPLWHSLPVPSLLTFPHRSNKRNISVEISHISMNPWVNTCSYFWLTFISRWIQNQSKTLVYNKTSKASIVIITTEMSYSLFIFSSLVHTQLSIILLLLWFLLFIFSVYQCWLFNVKFKSTLR